MIEGETDATLVRRIARGEGAREAEAEFCRRFAPRVRLYGLRHLGSEDRASDLVQGVLLAVLEATRQGRIEEPDHVDRFVLGTCRNVSLRVRQKEARMKPVADGAEEAAADVPMPFADVERIDAGALAQCMGKLDSRSRTVLVMTFLAESDPDEIAKALETSAGNVRVVRHRALAQLRRCLDGAEGARP